MRTFVTAVAALLLMGAVSTGLAQQGFVGFDRNGYPGDAALAGLRKDFSFAGYWLNNPPGEKQNNWKGKRALLKQNGFGFLVLFNGRLDAELKSAQRKGTDATTLGTADGKAAVAAAAREGFAGDVLIFLDQEEGGRLLQEQAAYLFAWVDAVRAGGATAGVYCSGIDVPEGNGTINTARNIVELEKARAKGAESRVALWIADDRCPPSPGCTLKSLPFSTVLKPEVAGSAVVWQYVQSPRRPEFSAGCPANAAPDGNCYAPGLAQGANTFLDLNVARSADPSEDR